MRVGVHLGPFWVSGGGRSRGPGLLSALLAAFFTVGFLMIAAALWLEVQFIAALAWLAVWCVCRYQARPAPKFWAVPPLRVQ